MRGVEHFDNAFVGTNCQNVESFEKSTNLEYPVVPVDSLKWLANYSKTSEEKPVPPGVHTRFRTTIGLQYEKFQHPTLASVLDAANRRAAETNREVSAATAASCCKCKKPAKFTRVMKKDKAVQVSMSTHTYIKALKAENLALTTALKECFTSQIKSSDHRYKRKF